MSELTLYDRAKHVLVEYQRVDEVKDFRDKAAAMAQYAKEANDTELEHAASAARLRAERRWGELYKQSEKAKAGRLNKIGGSKTPINNAPTLSDMNVTKNQSSDWQKLADIPEQEFEEILETQIKLPTAHSIIEARKPRKPPPQIDQRAVYLWGKSQGSQCFLTFIRENKLRDILKVTPDYMVNDLNQFLNELKEWLNDV